MYRKILFQLFIAVFFVVPALNAQLLNSVLKTVSEDTSAKKIIDGFSEGNNTLTTQNVIDGLKQALEKGTSKSTEQLSSANGFLQNAAVKILLPPEAKKAETALRNAGMGKLADDAITSMNRAAEDACKSASPIFVNAIKQITIQDAWGILKGSDTSATHYLKVKTTDPLTTAFKPVIQQSLQKTGATKYWSDFASAYNKINIFGNNKLDTNLSSYVTAKALDGIFLEIGHEEAQIRKDPAARTTDLLQKVFASNK